MKYFLFMLLLNAITVGFLVILDFVFDIGSSLPYIYVIFIALGIVIGIVKTAMKDW